MATYEPKPFPTKLVKNPRNWIDFALVIIILLLLAGRSF